MVESKNGDIEIISKEEKKLRDYKKQFEDVNESYRIQIEFNEVVIKYIEEKIQNLSK